MHVGYGDEWTLSNAPCVCVCIGFNDISLMFHKIIFSHSFRAKLLIIIPQKLAWRSKRSHRYTYTNTHTCTCIHHKHEESLAARVVIKNHDASGCVFFFYSRSPPLVFASFGKCHWIWRKTLGRKKKRIKRKHDQGRPVSLKTWKSKTRSPKQGLILIKCTIVLLVSQ